MTPQDSIILSKAVRIGHARAGLVALGAALLALIGCTGSGGVKLYDGTRAAVALEARQTFQTVKVTDVVNQNLANLDALLQKELAVVESDFQLKRDRALLMMADNRRPVYFWLDARHKELKAVGFEDLEKQKQYLDEFKRYQTALHKVEKKARRIRALGVEPPACSGSRPLPETWAPPGVPADPQKLNVLYKDYRKSCQQARDMKPSPLESGKIGAALEELGNAEMQVETEAQAMQDLTQSFKDAQKHYARAKKQLAANPTEARVKELQARAEALKSAFEALPKTAEIIGVTEIPAAFSEEIGVILTAFAKGEVDSNAIQAHPDLRAAAIVVSALPSLASEAGALAAAGTKPTVSNLLMALNHQRILLERARELKALSDKTIALYQRKVEALRLQAAELRQVQLHLCTLVSLVAGGDYPEGQCDKFQYAVSDGALTCTIGATAIAPCILQRQWRELLADRNLQPRQKRELYAAVLAYARALQAEAEATRIDFLLIDVAHRRTAVAHRAALLAWHNLIDVPTTQLAAYHASGIKPDALAKAIADLLGLSAIAVGAAQ